MLKAGWPHGLTFEGIRMARLNRHMFPEAIAALILVVFWTVSFAWAGADSITGIWNESNNEAQFEIYRCGSLFCGRIYSLVEPNDPGPDSNSPGSPKRDLHNPDPALRSRTLVGMPFMSGFEYLGQNTWKGNIYNLEDGRTYNCRLSMDGPNRLDVRGYVGIPLLGKTVTWTRAN